MLALSIKFRLYVLLLVPLTLLSISIVYMTSLKMNELSETQIQNVRQQMHSVKEETLKSYMEIIDSILIPLKQRNASREEAVQQLSRIKYGQSGYIFGYDSKGNRVFQGNTNLSIGKNFWDAKDSHNNYFIQDIIKKGKNGGGYSHYFFPRPGEKVAKEKLSYSVYEPQWDLVIGTGFYIDDIENTMIQMQSHSDDKTAENFVSIISLCAFIAAIVGIFGFLIVRSILSPLKQFDQSVAGFASGNADLTARMDSFSLPEFNTLSTNFNQFIVNLQLIVKSVTESSQNISNETHNSRQIRQIVSQSLKEKKQNKLLPQ